MKEPIENHYFQTNRDTWNTKVGVHVDSKMYDLQEFINGKSSLNKIELDALGEVKGKSLLHLQCHFGQDTLSWSRMGAKCTGVDLSDAGIEKAKQLNKQLQLDVNFVQCNVLDTSRYVSDMFDIVFTSYGVIGWLPDLKPWAKMIAERLKPGGEFYMVEFHPIVWMFDYTQTPAQLIYGYQQDEVIYEEYSGTYANQNSKMTSKEFTWNHGLSEVINALIDAGLIINYLNEYNETPYNVLPGLIANEDGNYTLKSDLYPLLYDIKATKP